VAIRTTVAGIAENQAGVAGAAVRTLMHATQWIPGLTVAEVGRGAQRFPVRGSVAVFTGEGQRTVRTGGWTAL
jgi:hypothetical protein